MGITIPFRPLSRPTVPPVHLDPAPPRKEAVDLVVKVWPDGRFSVGKLPTVKASDYDPSEGIERDGCTISLRAIEPERRDLTLEQRFDIHAATLDSPHTSPEQKAKAQEDLNAIIAQMAARSGSPNMGLSDPLNYHKPDRPFPKEQRGQSGITPYAKKIVSSGVYVLEQLFSGELGFITVTIPDLPPHIYAVLGEKFSEYRRRLEQEIVRELQRKGVMDPWYVGCVEIQEGRFLKYGQAYPHLHYVFHAWSPECGYKGFGTTKKNWAITPEWLTETAGRVFEAVYGISLDWSKATRIEKPRGGMGQEMGKYLSKGGKLLNAIKDAGQSHVLPSSWHGISRPLLAEVHHNTVRLTGQDAIDYVDSLEHRKAKGEVRYIEIVKEVHGWDHRTQQPTAFTIAVGYSGFDRPLPIKRTSEKTPLLVPA